MYTREGGKTNSSDAKQMAIPQTEDIYGTGDGLIL